MRTLTSTTALVALAAVAACGQGVRAADGDLPADDVRVLDGQQPLACGLAPLAALTEEPGAEKANTPEARALREVLDTGIAGMSFPPEDDWVVLQREDDAVTFGHREGALGIADVVTVRRTADGWGFGGSSGCGPLGWADGRHAGHTSWYTEQPGGIALEWTGGECDEPADPVVQVAETSTTVSLVFVPPSQELGTCSDVGIARRTVVPLGAPVGDRVVENAGYLPVRVVPSKQEYEQAQAAEAAAMEQAHRWCVESAAALGGTPQVDYPTDVATVRRHVPESAQAWSGLADTQPAAHCYLEAPDGATWAYVTVPGAEPIVLDRAYDRGGLFVRLGDPAGS